MLSAYMSSREHLADELKRLDLLLKLKIASDEKFEAGSLQSDTDGISTFFDFGDNIEQEKSILESELIEVENQIQERLELSFQNRNYLSIPYICELLNLGRVEKECLIICLAPELDSKYEKIYGVLLDDITSKRPSISMVLEFVTCTQEEKIAARSIFNPQSPFIKFLMEHEGDISDVNIPLISRHLKIDDWVVDFILDIHVLDAKLGHLAQMHFEEKEEIVPTEVEEKIMRFADYFMFEKQEKLKQILYFYGPDENSISEQVTTSCRSLKMPLVVADTEKIISSGIEYDEIIRRLGRQVMLQNAVLCLKNFDCAVSVDEHKKHRLNNLIQTIKSSVSITFIIGSSQWNPPADTEIAFVAVEFPYPRQSERKNFWEKLSSSYKLNQEIDLESFSGNFRFTSEQIQAALNYGESISVWNGSENGVIGQRELNNACYDLSNKNLGTLAARIKKTYKWDMLVLPREQMTQMEEICNQVKYRGLVYEKWGFERRLSLGKGLNVLFSGPPGSGKTMAAEVIANELNLEIYKIDVSQVVSKYIGETEKNLEKIFSEAETSNAILFFDEADSLFGKRSEVKDAHDRYANVEISYLLQRMEDYTGIVILATNLNQNIDDAFLRRLHFNVAFPFPEKEQRKLIWKGIFPSGAPVDSELDYDFLSERFNMAGGNIKNIALNAAFYAASESCQIGIKQIMLAAKREYKKMGKTFVKSDFSPYYQLIEVMT